MPGFRPLIAALVAAVSGYAVLRTGRAMTHEGVTLDEAGGWTALLIAEICVTVAAVGVALG